MSTAILPAQNIFGFFNVVNKLNNDLFGIFCRFSAATMSGVIAQPEVCKEKVAVDTSKKLFGKFQVDTDTQAVNFLALMPVYAELAKKEGKNIEVAIYFASSEKVWLYMVETWQNLLPSTIAGIFECATEYNGVKHVIYEVWAISLTKPMKVAV